jgi:hypothetical protein
MHLGSQGDIRPTNSCLSDEERFHRGDNEQLQGVPHSFNHQPTTNPHTNEYYMGSHGGPGNQGRIGGQSSSIFTQISS